MSNEVLYNNQVISFLEELWGDGFLSPGGSDEVKKVLEGIKIKGLLIHHQSQAKGGVLLSEGSLVLKVMSKASLSWMARL